MRGQSWRPSKPPIISRRREPRPSQRWLFTILTAALGLVFARAQSACDTGYPDAILNECPLTEIQLSDGTLINLVYQVYAWKLPFVRRSSETVEGTFVFTGKGFGTSDTPVSAPGPVLRIEKGANPRIRLLNEQDAPDDGNYVVNLHTHGLHVSPDEDDVTFNIAPGENHVYNYHFPTDHAGGTHWYHPHAHFLSELSTAGGAAGMIIVEDADDATEVPQEVADAPEIPLVLQHVHFDKLNGIANGSLTALRGNVHDDLVDFDFSDQGLDRAEGLVELKSDMYLVNGFWRPRVQVEQGRWYRFRVLNVAAVQDVKLTLYDDVDGDAQCRVVLIAKDGVYLPDGPRPMRFDLGHSVHLHPANRADLFVRCDGTVGAVADVYDSFNRFTDGEVDLSKQDIPMRELMWRVEVVASSTSSEDPIPKSFSFAPCLPFYMGDLRDETPDFNGGATLQQRQAYEDEGLVRPNYDIRWSRNSKVFYVSVEPDRLNDAIFERWGWADDLVAEQRNISIMVIGHVQEWVITANSLSHPLHVHVNHFQLVEDIDDGTGYHRRGDWVDTVRPRYQLEVPIRFQPDTFTGRIVLHCHNNDHSDYGAIGQAWVVSDPNIVDARVISRTRPWSDSCADTVRLSSGTEAPTLPPSPTQRPTPKPVAAPTPVPPTPYPTSAPPTARPTPRPTQRPTAAPTPKPTRRPTKIPTKFPTSYPTRLVTRAPTQAPTQRPTKRPTRAPTPRPTQSPTKFPTASPTYRPTSPPVIPQLCVDVEVSGLIMPQDGLVLRSSCFKEGQTRCWSREYGTYSTLARSVANDDSAPCEASDLARNQLTYELPPYVLLPGKQYTFMLESDDGRSLVDVAIADAALVSSFAVSPASGHSGTDPFSFAVEVEPQDGVSGPFQVRFLLEWDADAGLLIPLVGFASQTSVFGLVLPLTKASDANRPLQLYAQVLGDNGAYSAPTAAVAEVELTDALNPSLGRMSSTCLYVSASSAASRARKMLACASLVARLPADNVYVAAEQVTLAGRAAALIAETAQGGEDVGILALAVLSEVAATAATLTSESVASVTDAWATAISVWEARAVAAVAAGAPLYLAAPVPPIVLHLLLDVMSGIGARAETCLLRSGHALMGGLLASVWYNAKPSLQLESSTLSFEASEAMPVSEAVRAAQRLRVSPLGTFYSATWMAPEHLCAPASSQRILSSALVAVVLADKSANVYDAVGETRAVEAVFSSPSAPSSGRTRTCGLWSESALNWQSSRCSLTTSGSDVVCTCKPGTGTVDMVLGIYEKISTPSFFG